MSPDVRLLRLLTVSAIAWLVVALVVALVVGIWWVMRWLVG